MKELKTQQEFNNACMNDETIVTCPVCGRTYSVDYTEKEVNALIEYTEKRFSKNAILIQDVLPERNIYERQMMLYAWDGKINPVQCCKDCVPLWRQKDE